ncbi:MAG: glycosidase [Bacteroidales bacterium]|jgi:4-O-beta-D-mannosyl-D-glucose phosphorylase|nr:glycosidase [Bacteroidales bacterium]MDD2825032.1 glycosidase [Bacteroidales bacterium]MDD3100653.1 glycosidase [Bacteroidales bacterium]MDD3639318.1 glycosidase [Bacteroidales bacterium]MDD3943953.1 glycosidase [Bacteroidales bacterium]
MQSFEERLNELTSGYQELLSRRNVAEEDPSGWFSRYRYPVLTAQHVPLEWRYDLDPKTNPCLLQRLGVNAVFNAGAILWKGRHIMVARVEGFDRKSFFAVAESPDGINQFSFWKRPLEIPEWGEPTTNLYDMRLTEHQDGWIYGVFCAERKDPYAAAGDLSSAVASAGIARTRDLKTWERLPDLKSRSQQRNVVLHPEFVDGKYAFYTRPQDGFIDTGNGGGIGWTLVEDITNARVEKEIIINKRHYHTIKELKNGEGPAPLKTSKGWLHLAHGVRGCAAGLRYVLYLYVTSLEEPWKVIAEPAGHFMAPQGEERIGDVSNVLFSNGWIRRDDGTILIYYASSDSRMHVASTNEDILLDYCFNTAPDGLTSAASVKNINSIITKNGKI